MPGMPEDTAKGWGPTLEGPRVSAASRGQELGEYEGPSPHRPARLPLGLLQGETETEKAVTAAHATIGMLSSLLI